jgi:predicted metal-dependent phosphoesterase TrpH
MEIGSRIARPEGLSVAETHSHTTASDGMVTAVELVRAAATIGLSVICVTDHDTVSPLGEAIEVGAELGVDVVPGEEVTCSFPPGIHVVGIFLRRAVRMHMPEARPGGARGSLRSGKSRGCNLALPEARRRQILDRAHVAQPAVWRLIA